MIAMLDYAQRYNTFNMSWLKKLQQIYHQYLPLSHYVLALLFLLPIYPFLRHSLVSGNSSLVDIYAHLIRQGSVLMGQVLGIEQQKLVNIFLSETPLDTRFMAFWQTFLFVLGVSFLNTSKVKRVIWGVAGLLAIYLFNALRWLILTRFELWNSDFSIVLTNGTMVALLNAALLMFGYSWWKLNYPLKRLLIAQLQFKAESIRKVIRNLLIVSVLLILTQWVTYTQTLPLISWVSKGVLALSKAFLALLGYTTYLSGRYIYTSEAAIFFSDSCAGIELMLIYASFIAILNGKYKAWFIMGGIFIIFIMNVLRISLIMIYLIQHKGHYHLPFDIHDLYTYSVYLVTFILWAIWIHFFNTTEKVSQSRKYKGE